LACTLLSAYRAAALVIYSRTGEASAEEDAAIAGVTKRCWCSIGPTKAFQGPSNATTVLIFEAGATCIWKGAHMKL
jgi:hypothetical protein